MLDDQGIVSTWSIIELSDHAITDYELNMNLGGRYKMVKNYSDNLTLYPNIVNALTVEELAASLDVEFDPTNPQIFYFSTSEGLFRIDKSGSVDEPVKIDTVGLISPTALSMSDQGYLLVSFSCGSIW